MFEIFELSKLELNESIWLTIIAINMTVIGLTSLAETKKIIGVDYGKFLIKSYKLFGFFRIYYLLIVFAMINAISLFSMFILVGAFLKLNFIILLLSLVFAIFYFFSFILIENSSVKFQIYKSQFIGLYFKSDEVTTFEADRLVKMNNGSRSDKRLATNVITYFNTFNSDSQIAFKEIFAPDSFLYDNSNNNLNTTKNQNKQIPYNYKSEYGLNHISHEFFQLFRYSELQEKWTLEILKLFNSEYSKNNNEFRLDNVLRIIAHINTFGKCDNLYSYKFIEYLNPYIFEALTLNEKSDQSLKELIIKKQIFLLKELFNYVFVVLSKKRDTSFYRASLILCNKLTIFYTSNNWISFKSFISIIFESLKSYHCDINKDFVTEIINEYYIQNDFKKEPIGDIIALINLSRSYHKKSYITRSELFGE